MKCERCEAGAEILFLGRSYRYQDGAGYLRWARHRDIALCDPCHTAEHKERTSELFTALTLCDDYLLLRSAPAPVGNDPTPLAAPEGTAR